MSTPIRILLFGDDIGVPRLLRHIPLENVCGIVGAAIRPQYHTSLRQLAEKKDIPFCVQPLPADNGYLQFKEWVYERKPDLIWVSSYSMIVREDILVIPRWGGINIHGALLPQYRGCNPTQWAILNEENAAGVTIHEMAAGIDEGSIIDQIRVPLFFEDTWQSAQQRIVKAMEQLISRNLPSILAGKWKALPQEENRARYCRRRTPDDGLFNWGQSVVEIYNLIRALVKPLPGAFYIDENDESVVIAEFLTPAEVTGLKYSAIGGETMVFDRTRLRPLRREDGGLLDQWMTDLDLCILNASYSPVSVVDQESRLESMMHKQTDLVIFVIEDCVSGQAIGTCQLQNINWRHRSAELQIRIGSAEHQEGGFGLEAVKLLVEFGFKDLNLHRIYLQVLETDTRAIRAYEKCGFVQEGIMREAAQIDGNFVNAVCMGKLRDANG